MKLKIKIGILMSVLIVVLIFSFVFAYADGEIVSVSDTTVCCEKTNSGLYCQDVKEEDCNEEGRKIKTACESTSFCKEGWCYDSAEGTCMDNTPQKVCKDNNGTWTEEKPGVCELGCCYLSDSASFVTLVRCKRLSSFWGLETTFNAGIKEELQCILSAKAEEKGACVYVKDFEKTCKFTTRGDCTGEVTGSEETVQTNEESGDEGLVAAEDETTSETETSAEETTTEETDDTTTITGEAVAEDETTSTSSDVEFHAGMLCSAEELGTNCGLSRQTTCLDGKDEVYFVDTCGNPANIYDASKINDKRYWAYVIDKADACNPDSANANSQTCGNCNYLIGSVCRESKMGMAKATYGNYICADLGCVDGDGKERLHGESWCGYGGVGATGIGANSVGSKFYRYICINSEVKVEPCADFRQEVCIEDTLNGISQAGCRVNRWQDCTSQKEMIDCMNSDKRDCIWLEGLEYVLITGVTSSEDATKVGDSTVEGATSLDAIKQFVKESGGLDSIPKGACVPKNTPGLDFWGESDAAGVCAQANAACPVTWEKGLIGGDWECVEHCECLSKELEMKRVQLCVAMGDCGFNVNWLGRTGYKQGYTVKETKMEDD